MLHRNRRDPNVVGRYRRPFCPQLIDDQRIESRRLGRYRGHLDTFRCRKIRQLFLVGPLTGSAFESGVVEPNGATVQFRA